MDCSNFALISPAAPVPVFNFSRESVSSDFIGSKFSCIIDGDATIVNKNSCILYVWYDNEFGYASQIIRLLKFISSSLINFFPK